MTPAVDLWLDAQSPFVGGVTVTPSTCRYTNKMANRPIVVHCSAGIGRTGGHLGSLYRLHPHPRHPRAFCTAQSRSIHTHPTHLSSSLGTIIAINNALEAIDAKAECIDCCDIIKRIRQDRCALVQHPQQYEFVHEAILKYLTDKKIPFDMDLGSLAEEEEEEEEAGEELLLAQRQAEKEQAKARAARGGRALITHSQVRVFDHPCVRLTVLLFACLFACLLVCLLACLLACLFVCLPCGLLPSCRSMRFI